MLNELRLQIKQYLESITNFAVVYDFHKVGGEGFPACSFEPSNFTSEEYDSCNNKNTYRFEIVIQQEISKTSRGDGLDILVNSCEEVINKFKRNSSLGGLVERCITDNIQFGEILHDTGDILFCNITLSCEKLVL